MITAKFTYNSFIDYNTFIELKKLNSTERYNLFEKGGKTGAPMLVKYECKCEECNIIYKIEEAKTRFLSRFSWNHFICDKCKKEYFERRELNNKIERENRIKEERELKIEALKRAELEKINIKKIDTLTEKYIEKYLTPDKDFNCTENFKEKWESLKSDFDISKLEVAQKIRSMKYKDFLNTPYWKLIAKKVKLHADERCVVCNSTKNLQAHHRAYEKIHGYELHKWESELTCICDKCHEAVSKYKIKE